MQPYMIIILYFQSMAELLAENYHNIWARQKKMELEAKGNRQHNTARPLMFI